jgi:lambda family phage tail tape measure protein
MSGLGVGFKYGAAFNMGNVVQFAAGIVVNRPTFFPMANGNVGLMGEAGAEAIMPLARGADGKLGVKSSGSNISISVPVNVAGGSKKLSSELRRNIERTVEDTIRRHT